MKKFYSVILLTLLCLAGLSANAQRKTIITVDPASYAELRVYDQNARAYVVYAHLKSGADNEVTLQDGIGYYVVPGPEHIFGSVVSNDGAYPIQVELGDLGTAFMIYADATLSSHYYVYTVGPTPPAESGTNFFLPQGCRAVIKHYVLFDGDTLVDDLVTDKVLAEGDNYIDLVPTYEYYLVAADNYELASVTDADGKELTISPANDICPTPFVGIVGKDASTKYVVDSRPTGNQEVITAIKFILAEGSHANIFSTYDDSMVLLQTLKEGENFLNTSADDLIYIIPADGYKLSKVTDADGNDVKIDVNTAISRSNYVFVTEHLSKEFTIVTVDDEVGIDTIEASDNTPARFFDLQGRQVERPSAGLYIRVCGNTVSKVIVK